MNSKSIRWKPNGGSRPLQGNGAWEDRAHNSDLGTIAGKKGKTPGRIFPLIELLVVIAIIAILAGMLLPALKSARDQAHMIACVNRQKQFGQVFMLYADSFKEWSIGSPYPGHLPTVNASNGLSKWWTIFAKGNDNAAGTTCFDTAQGKREKMLTCPTARGSGRMPETQISDGSYSINLYLAQKFDRGIYNWANQGAADGNNNNKPSFFKPTTVPKPFNLFWLQCTASYSYQDFFFWHSGTTPMLFVDLSVKRLKKVDIAPYNGVYKAIWCYYPTSGSTGKTSL